MCIRDRIRRGPEEEKGKASRGSETIADIIDSAPTINDIKDLSMKYFINPRKANESAIIERSIKRREKRKYIAKIVNSRVCDAVEVFIHSHFHL